MSSFAPPPPSAAQHDLQNQLDQLIDRVRTDAGRVHDAGFRALLETTAEVLLGLKSAYRHHHLGNGDVPDPARRFTPDKADYYRAHLSPH
ncbi:MAG TPA: hypothetical protein VEB66_10735 [Opitutaceae bacterium]|nr:hypothetical protein [Opitutaceae bacterium]